MESVLTSDSRNNAISPFCYSFCLVTHLPPPLSFLLLLHFISAFFYDTSSLNEICKGMNSQGSTSSGSFVSGLGKVRTSCMMGRHRDMQKSLLIQTGQLQNYCNKSPRVLPRTPDTANWKQGDTSANWRDCWNRKKRETVFKWETVIFVKCLPRRKMEYHFKKSANPNITQASPSTSGVGNNFYSVLEVDADCLTLLGKLITC